MTGFTWQGPHGLSALAGAAILSITLAAQALAGGPMGEGRVLRPL
jgi:hypothetical protein